MKNLFESEQAAEIKGRMTKLSPTSERQWGKMTVSQMLAHCSLGIESATGAQKPPRMMIGRLLGWIITPLALGNDEPIKKNSPTVPSFVIHNDPDFATEYQRLTGLVDEFIAAGPSGCTTHPHAFFGMLTPEQWATLQYKHLDHHFRQFGA